MAVVARRVPRAREAEQDANHGRQQHVLLQEGGGRLAEQAREALRGGLPPPPPRWRGGRWREGGGGRAGRRLRCARAVAEREEGERGGLRGVGVEELLIDRRAEAGLGTRCRRSDVAERTRGGVLCGCDGGEQLWLVWRHEPLADRPLQDRVGEEVDLEGGAETAQGWLPRAAGG